MEKAYNEHYIRQLRSVIGSITVKNNTTFVSLSPPTLLARSKYRYVLLIYLGLGLLVTLTLASLFMNASFPLIPVDKGSVIFRYFFVLALVLGHFFFIRFTLERKGLFNVTQLFATAASFGAGATTLAYLPDALGLIGITLPEHNLFVYFYHFAKVYSIFVFFTIAFFLIKKLVFVRPSSMLDVHWQAFIAYLIALMVLQIPGLKPGVPYLAIMGGIAGVFSIYFLTRIKWIALIDKGEKRKGLLLLGLLDVFIAALIYKYYHFGQFNFIRSGESINLFMWSIMGFVGLYHIHSSFSLFFFIPVASVFEQLKQELYGFAGIQQLIRERVNEDEIYNFLFQHAINDTDADCGWLVSYDDAKPSHVYDQHNISSRDVIAVMEHVSIAGALEELNGDSHLLIQNIKNAGYSPNIPSYLRSMIILPVKMYHDKQGYLVLLKDIRRGFDEYKIRSLNGYIQQVELAFENADLLEEKLEGVRLKQELQIARKIQNQLIPQEFPVSKYFDLSGYCKSAIEIGGDFFDYYFITPQKMILTVGDITGKGIPAAMYMAEMKGIFQSLIQFDISPEKFIYKANVAVSECFSRNVFVSLGYFVIDHNERLLTYSRAGLCPILHYDSITRTSSYLNDEGLALGIIRGASFSEHISIHKQNYEPGDIVVVYSDGIVEARNDAGVEYGQERLKNAFDKAPKINSKEIEQYILEDLFTFTGKKEFYDDLTLVVTRLT